MRAQATKAPAERVAIIDVELLNLDQPFAQDYVA